MVFRRPDYDGRRDRVGRTPCNSPLFFLNVKGGFGQERALTGTARRNITWPTSLDPQTFVGLAKGGRLFLGLHFHPQVFDEVKDFLLRMDSEFPIEPVDMRFGGFDGNDQFFADDLSVPSA